MIDDFGTYQPRSLTGHSNISDCVGHLQNILHNWIAMYKHNDITGMKRSGLESVDEPKTYREVR